MVPKATKLKNDSLSYTYQVIVDVKYEQDPEYQHYEGVGMFVPDFAYEGKWYLESLNHQIFNQDKKNPVYIQIELSLGKYSGFNSCNWVGGKFICEGKRKQFLTEFSTLKACDGMVEADFTRAILGAVFIEIKNNKLVLSDSKSELAVFVR
jgi:heat shock protein HslJ